jgi:hypothetical protein
MPAMQAMVETANEMLNHNNLGTANANLAALAAPPTGLEAADLAARKNVLAGACDALGVTQSPAQRDYLSTWPIGLQETLRAAVQSAVNRSLAVQLTWMEGPYKLTIYEAADTDTTRGGMSINLQSPMPS